jgi:hypothetical protein
MQTHEEMMLYSLVIDNDTNRLFSAGMKNGTDGYQGLIEAALTISGVFRVDKQWQTVAKALERAFPSYILTMESAFSRVKITPRYLLADKIF